MKTPVCHRTGFGFDSHVFGAKGTLTLGGVSFPTHPALAGHSDGDALLHAVIDAILGAAGAGDIGQLFPDKDPAIKGISSVTMLRKAAAVVNGSGFKICHLDVTVVANEPRLTPARTRIVAQLAGVLGLPGSSISVKGKTQEGLTWFGKKKGIAVWAVATVQPAR